MADEEATEAQENPSIQPDEPIQVPLDANDLLNRAAAYDHNLINRVIAEAERDQLMAMLKTERQRSKA